MGFLGVGFERGAWGFLKSYFGKRGGGSFKNFLFFLVWGTWGSRFWRRVFLDIFFTIWGKGVEVGVVVRFFLFRRFFFSVWGKTGLGGLGWSLFKIWNFFYFFKFRVLGSGGGCFGFFKKSFGGKGWLLHYITRFLSLSSIVSRPTTRFYFIVCRGCNLFTYLMQGVHIWCNLRKLEKKKKNISAVHPKPSLVDPIFFVFQRNIKNPIHQHFFHDEKFRVIAKSEMGCQPSERFLGVFSKKTARISKEIELSYPCRAKEPEYLAFLFFGLRILYKFIKFVNYNGGWQTFGHGLIEFTVY